MVSQCQQYHLIPSEMFRVNLSLCDSEGAFLPLLRVLLVEEVERQQLAEENRLSGGPGWVGIQSTYNQSVEKH
ncbi:hypothetical protein V1478_014441 [Vespula squamosa]|uniref:Uncharacterized protein n=1 Tax=Vespula squamosa TaxID=30214 RepID=A0ABD2AAN2_VESSQ